ncbi:serine/threonine-protein kinase [Streptomyces spinosirectus]
MLLADRYQLEELLGSGAMGEVWRAADHVLGRPVAVKLLKAEEAMDAERFRMEAQTAGRLNHPHVVGVYDFGSDEGRLYLVMELVDGWSLAQERSMRGVLPPDEAAAIAAQTAAGLSAAHRQGVVHRDIKPANVMISTDRTVKITDFGIARFADDAASTMTATGKIIGTADYMAPERALGRPTQPASDVYSLGCVLYHLLTGRPPFQGATSLAVVQQHVDAVPTSPAQLRPEIPPQLAQYVMQLLAKDPAARPTAEQVAQRLGAQEWTPTSEAGETALTAAPPVPEFVPSAGAHSPATHSRPRGRGKTASRAVLGGAAIVLFTSAAAIGASLNSGDEKPSSPPSSVASSTAPAHVSDTPSAPPSSAASSTVKPPVAGPGHGEGHGGKGRHGKEKGKGPDN